MKTRKSFITSCAFAAALLMIQSARAQVPQVASDTALELLQLGTNNTGKITTTKAPFHLNVNTKTLLQDLAEDETLNGTWFAGFDAKAPPGAKLVVQFPAAGNFSSLSYKVVKGAETVDVSNLISAAPAGTNALTSSSFTDAGGPSQPPYTTSEYLPYTITYDSRKVGGSLWFTVTGIATCTTTTGKPTPKGVYAETDSFSLGSGTGSGSLEGVPFIITGATVTATGTQKLQGSAPALEEQSTGAGDTQVAAPPSQITH